MCENQSAGGDDEIWDSSEFRTHDLYIVSAVRSSFEILITPQGYLPHHAACFARFFLPLVISTSQSHIKADLSLLSSLLYYSSYERKAIMNYADQVSL